MQNPDIKNRNSSLSLNANNYETLKKVVAEYFFPE